MKTDRPEIPWIDPAFLENQRQFPREELARYAGQHIAWSWDGTEILDSAPDEQSLDQKLRAAGIDPGRVVIGYVDDPNVSYL